MQEKAPLATNLTLTETLTGSARRDKRRTTRHIIPGVYRTSRHGARGCGTFLISIVVSKVAGSSLVGYLMVCRVTFRSSDMWPDGAVAKLPNTESRSIEGHPPLLPAYEPPTAHVPVTTKVYERWYRNGLRAGGEGCGRREPAWPSSKVIRKLPY